MCDVCFHLYIIVHVKYHYVKEPYISTYSVHILQQLHVSHLEYLTQIMNFQYLTRFQPIPTVHCLLIDILCSTQGYNTSPGHDIGALRISIITTAPYCNDISMSCDAV